MTSISVIIPVFNASQFIRKAVISVLQQKNVMEIILVEDNSEDSSLEICEKLASENIRVKLFRHINGINNGAAASRNLGIEKSSGDLIAFLDADDIYLEGRFDHIHELFEKYPDSDGFYGKAVYQFYSEEAQNRYFTIYDRRTHVGLSEVVLPENLFEVFISKRQEWFVLDTIVIKRSLLEKVGLFDPSLRQAEDTDFLLRCCLYGRLHSTGEQIPIVRIGVHCNNSVLDQGEAEYYRFILLKKWIRKAIYQNFSKPVNRYLIRSFLDSHPEIIKYRSFTIMRIFMKVYFGLRLSISYPKHTLTLVRKVL